MKRARVRPDGSVESQYVYGAHTHVPDLALEDGRAYRLVTDHLGGPRLVVVDSGAIAQRHLESCRCHRLVGFFKMLSTASSHCRYVPPLPGGFTLAPRS
jgi:hypothetical protein